MSSPLMPKVTNQDVIPVCGPRYLTAVPPRMISDASAAANFAWEEFFIGKLRNPYTRRAYLHAVRHFLGWCEQYGADLPSITPGMVGRYFDELQVSVPSKKLYLAAIRSFFDVLVQRHVIVLNPASSVRTERYSVVEGKTPEISIEQARKLLASIRVEQVIDYRDRAVIAVLIYTAARAGAIARLRMKDFQSDGTQYMLRFTEKGGKVRGIPVRHDLELYLQEYMLAANLLDEPKDQPFFRSGIARTGRTGSKGMTGVDICRMVKRRLAAAELPAMLSPHSFRSCTATDLLLQGIPLEDVQYLLGHSDSRTTALYDRRRKQVTRNIVERISV